MKKIILAVTVFLIICLSCIYLIIPSTIIISRIDPIRSYQNGITRFFRDSNKIREWGKTFALQENNGFTLKGYTYTFKKGLSSLVKVFIRNSNFKVESVLFSMPVYKDSSNIYWETKIKTGINPFARIKKYFEIKRLKENMNEVANHLKSFLDKNENIYGIHVEEINLRDSLLISAKTMLNHYPTEPDIYKEADKLKAYAKSKGAGPTDSVMLHVEKLDSLEYEMMVGLPINKDIPGSKDIHTKRMPYGKSMFVSVITGGTANVQKGMEQLKLYLIDSERASPAIPYEMLITNRLTEKDSTKWVTRLYYPVM